MDRVRVASRSRGSGSSQRRSQSSTSPASSGPDGVAGPASLTDSSLPTSTAQLTSFSSAAASPPHLTNITTTSTTSTTTNTSTRGRPRVRLGSSPLSSPPTASRLSDHVPPQSRLLSLPPLQLSGDKSRSASTSAAAPISSTTTTTNTTTATGTTTSVPSYHSYFTSSPPVSPTAPSRRDNMRTRSRAAEPATPASAHTVTAAAAAAAAAAAEDDAVSKGGHSLRKRTRIDYNHMEHGDAIDFLQATATTDQASPLLAASMRGRKRRLAQTDFQPADDTASSPTAAVTKKIRLVNHNYTSSAAAPATNTSNDTSTGTDNSNGNSNSNATAVTIASNGTGSVAKDANGTIPTGTLAANTSNAAKVASEPYKPGPDSSVATPTPAARRGRPLSRKTMPDVGPAPTPAGSQAGTPHSDGIVVQDTIEVGSPVSSDTEHESSGSGTPPERPPVTTAAASSTSTVSTATNGTPKVPPITVLKTPWSASASAPLALDAKSLQPPSTAARLSRPRRQSAQSPSAETKPMATVESSPEAADSTPELPSKRNRRLMLRLPYGRNRSPPTVFPIASDADKERFDAYLATRAADARAAAAMLSPIDGKAQQEFTKADVADAAHEDDVRKGVVTADLPDSELQAVPKTESSDSTAGLPEKSRDHNNSAPDHSTPIAHTEATDDAKSHTSKIGITNGAEDAASSEKDTAVERGVAEALEAQVQKAAATPDREEDVKKSQKSRTEEPDLKPTAHQEPEQDAEGDLDPEPEPMRPLTRRHSTRIASAVAHKGTAAEPASDQKQKFTTQATRSGQAGAATASVPAANKEKHLRPWELLTPFTDETLAYPEQFNVPITTSFTSNATAEDDEHAAHHGVSTASEENGHEYATSGVHDDEPSQDKAAADGKPDRSKLTTPVDSDSVAGASPAVDVSTRGTPAPHETTGPTTEHEATATTKPMWKKQYRFKKIRDPKEFVDVLKDHKNMSTEELYACLAHINETLVAWQDEYRFLRGIADDEENAVRRRQQDTTFENRTALAIKRGNTESEVIERDFVVKGIRAPETVTDIVKHYTKTQDKIMSQVYLFEYDARDSMVGRQDPVAQRQGLQNTRLRNRPKQTLKAAEAEAADDIGGVGTRRTRRRKNMDDESRDNSRAGTPAASTPAQASSSSATATGQRGRRGRRHGTDDAGDGPSVQDTAGPAELSTPKRGRRGRAPKSLLSESMVANEMDDEQPTPPSQGRRRRRRGVSSGGGVDDNGSPQGRDAPGSGRRTRITVVKRDGHSHLGEIGPDRFYSGVGDDTRPSSSSSSDDTTGTADSSYSLRPARRRRRFHDEDDGDENNEDEADPDMAGPPAKKQRRRRTLTSASNTNATPVGAAGSRSTAAMDNAASQRHVGSNNVSMGVFPAAHPQQNHNQHSYQQVVGSGSRSTTLAPTPPGSGRQRTTFKIKNYTPAPVTASVGMQAFTQMMPNNNNNNSNGHHNHGHHHGGHGNGNSRHMVAGNPSVMPHHGGGAGPGAGSGRSESVSGGDDGKDYRQMTKSEKMSHSMKTRWANGSMQAAVAKRKATLAAKKIAAQQAAAAHAAAMSTSVGGGEASLGDGAAGGGGGGGGPEDAGLYYERPVA